MRFRILGPLEVLSPNGWSAIGAAKWRSLLACLLVRPGELVPTERLIDELWGETPPPTANNLVSIYVHRLRKEVIGDADGSLLVRRAPGYLLRVAPGDLDIHEFNGLVASGRDALAAADPDRAARLLAEALALWRGPLLADVPESALLAQHADRAAESRLAATELRIDADVACGRSAEVVAELRGLVSEHPLREGLWLRLVRALSEAGRQAEALEAYARARQTIADELGTDPGSELQRLHAELLAADASSTMPRPRTRRAPTGPGTGPGAREAGTNVTADTGAGPFPGAPPAQADETGDDAAAGRPHADSPGTIAIGTIAEPASTAAPAAASAAAGRPAEAIAVPAAPMACPAQLPTDIGDFTGRETHVGQLCNLLLAGNPASTPGAVPIAVVSGAGGLGKTTLAVHAAHQVRDRFPDGQLYVDLLGASAQPAEPGEVLARFLRELGIAGEKVPARDDERAALFRTTLVGRRVLILLDNARDAAQVRPLLPGSSSCAVLVTARNRTSDLASTRFVDLNVLEDTEALELFSRVVGEDRAAAEPDATAEVLVACAGLPLAIRICAARLAARRQWRIATLAGRLRSEHRRLDELSIGDLAVRASFQVSYDSLRSNARGADPARVFRLLGLWQGPRISLAAAAALLGAPEEDAADALETLVDANLLESSAEDWYRLHDLLRVYATERAEAEESEAAREEAMRRLLWWYLETAEGAADTVAPHRYQVTREREAESTSAAAFGGVDEALAWYDDERMNVAAATRQAAASGLHEIAWRLPAALFPLFNRRSHWADCVITLRIAAESGRDSGNGLGEALVLYQLGWALARLRDETAFGHLERALAIRTGLGDTIGEAQAAIGLGEGYLKIRGVGADALRYMQLAVDLLKPTGASSLRGIALNNLGEVYWELGNPEAAAECYSQAREIFHEIGGQTEGHALHNLARVYLHLGRVDEAIACLLDAIPQHRSYGDLVGEATALKHLGQAHEKTGDLAQARTSWAAAQSIFEQIGEKAEAAEVAAALSSLPPGDSDCENPELGKHFISATEISVTNVHAVATIADERISARYPRSAGLTTCPGLAGARGKRDGK
ncbi:MAG: BTAD domain-containing putative transcriptional regulator [Trebonia sp.]|jgi:DNA-binding SARP family transcriptional activator